MKHFDTIKRLTILVCAFMALSTTTFATDILTLDNGDRIIITDIELMCDNATDGGTISGVTKGCADPTYDPPSIDNVTLPSGGTGTLEYIWISTTGTPGATGTEWTPIEGSTGISYDPTPISVETSYRRCARRSGCTEYVAESNIVTIVLDCCDNVTDGGTIEMDQSVCGSSIDPDPITNVALPSGGSGNLEYVWLSATDCSNYFDGNTDWTIVPNSNSPTYDPGVLTETTCFIRCARRAGCVDFIGETNVVTITVNPAPTASIETNSQAQCDNSGKLTASGSEGTAPYTYSWSNGQSTAMIGGLAAGTYTVVISDANGCSDSESATITAAQAPTASVATMDVSCSDSSDGMATVTASGGSGTYSYNFSAGTVSGNKASNLSAGTYTVTVTDGVGCTVVRTFSINKPTAVYVDITKNEDPKCTNSGKLTANATGGSAPYSYSWSNGEATAMISGLSAGTYTVTATDDNGCTNVQSYTLSAANSPSVSVSSSDLSCYNDSDATAMATASGGSGNYTYLWSNGGSSATISGLSAGTYSVTIMDSYGCTATGSTTIANPSPLTVSASGTDPTCGENNGSASASASGGTGSITYTWSNGMTGTSISGLAPGTYTVSAKDANGCTKTAQVTISNVAGPSVSVSSTHLACYNDQDATATASATGGTMPYSYAWSNNDTGASIYGLGAGTYTVTVTDANGCTATESTTIANPTPLTVTASGTDATCSESNGSATASASGGTGSITYSWSNGMTTASISGLAAGTYTVTAMDANGCSKTAQVTVNNIGGPTVSASSTTLDCNGDTDATATASASGGTMPYTYAWSNNNAGASISGLGAGTYTVTVTDANGCTSISSTSIADPTPLTVSASGNDATCDENNGSATASASGGTGAITYSWSNGTAGATISGLAPGTYTVTAMDANGCTKTAKVTISNTAGPSVSASSTHLACYDDQDATATASATGGTMPYSYAWSNNDTGASISGLGAGTYTVTVTDANGCTATGSTTIANPTPLTVAASGTDATCNESNGSATASASGGTGTITYSWDNGMNGASISGLAAGTYTVTAKDPNGCTKTAQVTVNNVDGPTVTANSSTLDCYGDKDATATAAASGGTMPYTYAWSNNDTGASISSLGAGTYSVTVTDANGCTSTSSTTITDPTPLSLTASGNDATCDESNGSATASASGGTGAITYSWSNGTAGASISGLAPGTYTVTAMDANGCTKTDQVTINNIAGPTVSATSTTLACYDDDDATATAVTSGGTGTITYSWDNGMNGATITGLGAGTYTVTASDANGCIATATTTIVNPTPLTVSASGTDATCNESNGSATASATGGTGSITYSWDNGMNGASISGLAAGTYTVTAVDANGCTKTAQVSVNNVGGPTVSVSGTHLACYDDHDATATAAASGGTMPYTYAWSNNDTGASISGLGAGTYTVTVTDANGCTATSSTTISDPTPLTVSASGNDATCDDNNGSATAMASGGTGAITYSWSNGTAGASISGLAPGTYTVTAMDANGCTKTDQVTINNIAGPTVTASSSDLACNDDQDGTATAVASGGTMPYTYAWSGGGSSATISDLGAGTYTVTVSDANGCTAIATTTITNPIPLTVSVSGTDATCSESNGTATVSASGGTGSITFSWSNMSTGNSVGNLAAGTYTVTATDANGCTKTAQVTIGNIGGPSATISSSTNVQCHGESTGTATVTASGGTTPYTYLWSNGQTSATATGLAVGNYTVTVKDANGCTAETGVSITQPNQLAVNVTINDQPGCDDRGSLTANVTGGTGAYSYSWNTGSTGASISGLGGGTYTIDITDANGCTATATATLTESVPGTVTVVTVNNLCNGDADGKVTATLTGGTAPITWSFTGGTQSGNMATNLSAGAYGATATDANGCVTTVWFDITEPTAVGVSTTSESAGCDDESGKATATPTGGTGPYTYLWENMETTAMISGLMPGTYGVTVTDHNGCAATGSAIVANDTDLVCSSRDVKPATCHGGNDGRATAVGTGGQAPYSYNWSTGANQATATNLSAGTYYFTVTDENGCECRGSVIINEPDAIVCDAYITSDLTGYNSNDGSAKVNPSGGTQPYSYLWSNGSTQMSATNLGAGTASVTVTDINGCMCQSSVILDNKSQLGDLVFNDLNGNGLQDDGESGVPGIDVTLTNLDDGTMTTVMTDGDGNYLFDGLDAGNYKVTFDLPAGFTFSPQGAGGDDSVDSDVDPDMGMTSTIVLGDGESNLDIDAGIVRNGINIGDYVWIDTNQDGIQNIGETGIGGITVTLTNTMSNATRTTTTDGAGLYGFSNVEPSKYKITFSGIADGYQFTAKDAGMNDEIDSDAMEMGMTDEFMVMLGDADDLSFDAGIHLICDNVVDPGTIGHDQKLCGEYRPDNLTNVTLPSGGNGMIEYIWMKNETGTMSTPTPTDPNWIVIPNSIYPNYNPGIVRTTTFYVRCARRKGCTTYAESNVVTIAICPLPSVDVTYTPEDNCLADLVDLEAMNAGAGATYSWSIPGASPSSADTRVVTGIDYPSIGAYEFTLTVTSAEGCVAEKTFDIWIGCAADGVLFDDITAKSTESKSVKLDWTLESQAPDNEYFIEQSADDISYEVIGSVEGEELMEYSYVDESPKLGTSYYRVKHIDSTGEHVMSPSVMVVLLDGSVKKMFAYPNPASDMIKLELFEPLKENGVLYIYDSFGRTLKSVTVGANTQFIDVDLSDLTRGSYIIEVQYDGFKKYRQKVIKAER